MKIAIVVLSYFDNDIYSELYRIQNETWNSIHVENVDTYFLIGNCQNNQIKDDLIETSVVENIMCGEKVIKGFELLQQMNYDFIFRTNSSSYVDKQRLKSFILGNCNEDSYCGIIGNYGGNLFASGSGFIISKKILELILKNSNLWDYNNYFDDVGLGILMQSLNKHPQSGLRQDIVTGGYIVDPSQYHYRIKCSCPNRVDVEREWFYDVHKSKFT